MLPVVPVILVDLSGKNCPLLFVQTAKGHFSNHIGARTEKKNKTLIHVFLYPEGLIEQF